MPVPPLQMEGCQPALGLCSKTGQGLAGKGQRTRHCRLVQLSAEHSQSQREAPWASSAEPRSSLPFSITGPISQSISESQHDHWLCSAGCCQNPTRIPYTDRSGPAGLKETLPRSKQHEINGEWMGGGSSRQRGE